MAVHLVDVLVQIVALIEAFLTNRALIRFETLVDAHMGVEVILLVEQTVADVAFVRFFACVGPDVRFEVVRLNELFSAVRTVEWFRGRMDQRVATEFFLIWKRPRTEGTFKRILKDVCLHMGLQVVRLGECLLTDLAFMGFNLIVLLHVIAHIVLVHEDLVTHCTNVGLLICIANPNMLGQLRWMMELRSTDFTDKRMGTHMGRKIVLLVETFFANGASIGTFIRVGPNVRFQVV